MIEIKSTPEKLTLAEHLTLRPYYFATMLTDTIQTVVKSIFTAFSAIIAGLMFGQSTTMNKWCIAHAKDTWLSMKMTAYAASGIFVPEVATRGRESINSQGVNELSDFKSDEIQNAKMIERAGMRVQFVANMVKEAFCLAICGVRYLLSLACKWINLRKSHNFEHICMQEFIFFGGHLTYTFGSLQGVAFPRTVTMMFVKG